MIHRHYSIPCHNIWLTERQVAEMTGISRSTLQKNRFYQKGIPYSKVGASVRYALADVQAYMESCHVSFIK